MVKDFDRNYFEELSKLVVENSIVAFDPGFAVMKKSLKNATPFSTFISVIPLSVLTSGK